MTPADILGHQSQQRLERKLQAAPEQHGGAPGHRLQHPGAQQRVLALPAVLRVQFAHRAGEMRHKVRDEVNMVTRCAMMRLCSQVHCLLWRPALGQEDELAVSHEQGGARDQLLQEQIHPPGEDE